MRNEYSLGCFTDCFFYLQMWLCRIFHAVLMQMLHTAIHKQRSVFNRHIISKTTLLSIYNVITVENTVEKNNHYAK